MTLVTIVPPSGYAEEQKAAAAAAAGAAAGVAAPVAGAPAAAAPAAGAAAPAAGAAAPAAGAKAPAGGGDKKEVSLYPARGCRVMLLFVGLGNPGAKYARNRPQYRLHGRR